MFEFQDFDFGQDLSAESYQPRLLPERQDCLRCGVCINSCPTYQVSKLEQETPRNRVQLLEKLLLSGHPLSADEQQQLQNCLQCRACETVCPSQMQYGHAFDQAQAQLQPFKSSWISLVALKLIERKSWRRILLVISSLYLRSGLQKPMRASGLLSKFNLANAERLLKTPSLSKLHRDYPCKKTKSRHRVALFTGCLAEHFDRPVHLAAIKLLNALGYEVVVPDNQVCCGAIHQHQGHCSENLIGQNIDVFYELEVDAVIYTATACGAMLHENLEQDTEKSGWLFRHLYDINHFLLQNWPEHLPLAASNLTVAVHEPCSQRNILKNQHNVYSLLKKIPHLTVVPLEQNTVCCGSGGSYMLSHPETAAKLCDLKQQQIASAEADLLVSSNFACGFYLNANQSNNSLKVLHPIQLLADRL